MRSLVALLAASGVALVVVAPGAEAEPFAGGPHPQTVARSFRAVEQGPALVVLLSWEEPESLAIRQGAQVSRRPFIVERNGVTYDAPGLPGEVARRTFAARPDAHSFLEELTAFSDFVLARARAGKRRLAAGTTAGEASWTTSFRLPANDCAGRAAARITLSLSRETLLPLRVRERVRRDVNTFRWTYSVVNDDLPASEFATPRLGARPFRVDRGFRRTAPASAASRLSYAPKLPTTLPPGFDLAVAGWAPRSERTGAEGSVPRRRELFAAVFRRGFERIDVTQRLAGGRSWEGDPFAVECGSEYAERAMIRGVRGWYGIGPEIPPHLYWRRGRVLYTVSGPFPKRDLLAIARSLAPVH